MENLSEKKNCGVKSFIPLLTFLAVYLGAGIVFSVLGTENPFKQISRRIRGGLRPCHRHF